MSQHMTYLFGSYTYARAMGPPRAASFASLVSRPWSQALMWRSSVRRPLCTVLIIRIGIFWRRSSEGTWVAILFHQRHVGHFSSPLVVLVCGGLAVFVCFLAGELVLISF